MLAVLLAIAPAAAKAEQITLLADPWCPYNCEPGSDRPGFMVEIAREALALSGHQVEYRVLNWMRSLHRVKLGEAHGVIGAVPEEAPDFVFGPPMGTCRDIIAVRRGDALDLSVPGALDGKIVGAINGYEYMGLVDAYIRRHRDDRSKVQFATGLDPLAQNLKKLVSGRVDVVADAEMVLRHKIAELELGEQVELVLVEEAKPVYVAFSPALDISPRLARELESGVEALRRSGRLAQIMARYGLQDWN